MIRLLKYYRKYLAPILLVVALLFIQANADLALPDYMSGIVNIGLQQEGVPDSVPEIIRQSEMEKAFLFMDEGERKRVGSDYVLVAPDSAESRALSVKYPLMTGESHYLLRQAGSEERKALDSIFRQALAPLQFMESASADPQRALQFAQGLGFDLSRLPPGTDLFSALKALPAPIAATIIGNIGQRLAQADPVLLGQLGVRAVRDEYARLGMDMAKFQASYIAAKGALMLLLTLVSVLATILVGYLGSRVAAGVARDLRWNLFAKVESFSLAEFDRFSTASLITRSTNDVSQMQMVTQIGLRMMFYAPIVGIGGIVRATSKASDMWWIIAVAVATLLGLVGAVFLVSLPKFTGIQKLTDRLNLVVRENLSGMMVIRAFAREEYERQRFEEANGDLSRTMLFVQRVMTIMMPLMMVIMNLFSILIIWVGAHEVARSSIRIGDMMAFMQYSMQIFFSFLALSMMFIMLPRATVSADRIADVLETESAIKDPENPLSPPPDAKGVVEFRNVDFRYPGADEEVLRDISFTAAPGSTTAIVGTTGSGKSTLVALVPRLYDVTDGAILVDGIDVRRMSQRELRARIGFVPQKTSLFSGTIESNLLYADEKAAPEDIKEALATSQASEFVDGMPEGMLAPISQGGSNVSGGQKQRLTIARALVRKAPVCIFDDSFSALDFRTDSRLRSALREKAGYSTVFLVAQRIATIKDANQIIVLDQGRMVGKGRHRELMETCDVYRNIALSQLKREELA